MVFVSGLDSSESSRPSERRRGDIRDSPFAGRAKEYSWSLCQKYAPRNITPTDIDYAIDCNGRFLFFEMKTIGQSMTRGQDYFFNRLLSQLEGSAVLMIVEHEPLDSTMTMPDDVKCFEMRWFAKGGIHRRHFIGVEAFIEKYQGFFRWAERASRQ